MEWTRFYSSSLSPQHQQCNSLSLSLKPRSRERDQPSVSVYLTDCVCNALSLSPKITQLSERIRDRLDGAALIFLRKSDLQRANCRSEVLIHNSGLNLCECRKSQTDHKQVRVIKSLSLFKLISSFNLKWSTIFNPLFQLPAMICFI